jgi:hypothetical protein
MGMGGWVVGIVDGRRWDGLGQGVGDGIEVRPFFSSKRFLRAASGRERLNMLGYRNEGSPTLLRNLGRAQQ